MLDDLFPEVGNWWLCIARSSEKVFGKRTFKFLEQRSIEVSVVGQTGRREG